MTTKQELLKKVQLAMVEEPTNPGSVLPPMDLYFAARTNMSDHDWWTYETIYAFYMEAEEYYGAALNRLLQVQEELGSLFVPHYGEEVGSKVTQLFTEHIKLAVPVVTAAKAGDKVALKKAIKDWYANAAEISQALSGLGFEEKVVKEAMDMHLAQTLAYAAALFKKDYAQAIKNFDVALEHMEHFGTLIAEGWSETVRNTDMV